MNPPALPADEGHDPLGTGTREVAAGRLIPPRPRAVASSRPGLGWALPLLLALAAVPRLIDALRNPLIFDEIYSLHLARLGLHGLLATLSRDVDQPLHFLVVWAWRAIGGEADLWIKIPPLLFALATVWVTARLGRAMFGETAGLVAAALLALQPTHVLYSQQARFHAMLWLILTALLWLAWRWLERPSRGDAIGMMLLMAAALYTDWFSVFVIGAIALWGTIALRGDPRRLGVWLAVFALGVMLYAPQMVTLVAQIRRDVAGERLLPPMSGAEIGDLLRKLAYNARYLVPVLAALALAPLAWRSTRRPAALLWVVALLPVLLPWWLSVQGVHLFIGRQMLFTMPIVCLLAGAAATRVRPSWAQALAVAALVLVTGRACLMRTPLEETRDLPLALEELRAHGEEAGTIVSCETRALLFVQHYLPNADVRLLVMPTEEPFHYSDGILIVPESRLMTPDQWRALAVRGPWAGVRLEHAGRDGAGAADLLTRATNGRVQRYGRVSVWEGGGALGSR